MPIQEILQKIIKQLQEGVHPSDLAEHIDELKEEQKKEVGL